VGTATSSIQELYDIYKIACGGSNCNLADNVTWPILSSAAQTKYGFTPQFFQFDQDGLVFGVSNDPCSATEPLCRSLVWSHSWPGF
jgi:hypothetical protein